MKRKKTNSSVSRPKKRSETLPLELKTSSNSQQEEQDCASSSKKKARRRQPKKPSQSSQPPEIKFEIIDSNFYLEDRARQYLFYFRANLEAWASLGLPKTVGSIIISYWLPLSALISMLKIAYNSFDKPFFPTVLPADQNGYSSLEDQKKLLNEKIIGLTPNQLLGAIVEHKKFLGSTYCYEKQEAISPSFLISQAMKEKKQELKIKNPEETNHLFWTKFSHLNSISDLETIWKDFFSILLQGKTLSETINENVKITFFSQLLFHFSLEIKKIKDETNTFTSRALLESNNDLPINTKIEKYELHFLEEGDKIDRPLKPNVLYLNKIPHCQAFGYQVQNLNNNYASKGTIPFTNLGEIPYIFDQASLKEEIFPKILAYLAKENIIHLNIELTEYYHQAEKLANLVENKTLRRFFNGIEEKHSSKTPHLLTAEPLDMGVLTLLVMLIFKSPDLTPHLFSLAKYMLEKRLKPDAFPLTTAIISTDLLRYREDLYFRNYFPSEISFKKNILLYLMKSLNSFSNPIQALNELFESKFFTETLSIKWSDDCTILSMMPPPRRKKGRVNRLPLTETSSVIERDMWIRILTSEALAHILIKNLSSAIDYKPKEFWLNLMKKYWGTKKLAATFSDLTLSRNLISHCGEYIIQYYLQSQFDPTKIAGQFIFYLDPPSRRNLIEYIRGLPTHNHPYSDSFNHLQVSLEKVKNINELPTEKSQHSSQSNVSLRLSQFSRTTSQQDATLLQLMKQKGIFKRNLFYCFEHNLKESLSYLFENYKSLAKFYENKTSPHPEYKIEANNIDLLSKALELRELATQKIDLAFYGELFQHFISKDRMTEILFLVKKLYAVIGPQALWLNPMLANQRDEFNHPILYVLNKACLTDLKILRKECPHLFEDWFNPSRRLRVLETVSSSSQASHASFVQEAKRIALPTYSPCRFNLVIMRLDPNSAPEREQLVTMARKISKQDGGHLPVVIISTSNIIFYGRAPNYQWRSCFIDFQEAHPFIKLCPPQMNQPIIKSSDELNHAAYSLIKAKQLHIQPFTQETLPEIVTSLQNPDARAFLTQFYPSLLWQYFEKETATEEKDRYLMDIIHLTGPTYQFFAKCCEFNLLNAFALLRKSYKGPFPEKAYKDLPEWKAIQNGYTEVFIQAILLREDITKTLDKNLLISFLNAAQFYQKTEIVLWLVTKLSQQCSVNQIWDLLFEGKKDHYYHPIVFLLKHCNIEQLRRLHAACPHLLNHYPGRNLRLPAQLGSDKHTSEWKMLSFRKIGAYVDTLPTLLAYLNNPDALRFYQSHFPALLDEPSMAEKDACMLSMLQKEGMRTSFITRCFELNLTNSLDYLIQMSCSEHKSATPKPHWEELLYFASSYKRTDVMTSLLPILYPYLGPQGLWLDTLITLKDKKYIHPLMIFLEHATLAQLEEVSRRCPKIWDSYPSISSIQKIVKKEKLPSLLSAKQTNSALRFKDIVGKQGDTLLSFAIAAGNINTVKFLLNRHPEQLQECNREGENCLKAAIQCKQIAMIPFLLEAGADPSQKDSFGDTIFDMENITPEERLTLQKYCQKPL